MAWRIADSVVRGEIDNRLPGIIKGTLYLEGLKEPIVLELEGNCDPDLAGRHLTFRNLMAATNKSFEGFGRVQCGEAGTMSADRVARIPTIPKEEVDRCIKERQPIPTRWSESLYLEWFSANGRVLIEGASFACSLSPASWKLSEEAHAWALHLKERAAEKLFSEQSDIFETEAWEEPIDEHSEIEDPIAFRVTQVNGRTTHPLVRRVSEFVLQLTLESKTNRFYVDDSIQNQPLEAMIESTARATIRLAHAMAKMTGHELAEEVGQIVQGLKRARWSLAEASEHAGLAKYMGSADTTWLKKVRHELRGMRKELHGLIHDYEERIQELTPANQAAPQQAVHPSNPAGQEGRGDRES